MELERLLEWDVVQKPIMLKDGKEIINGKALVRSDNDEVLEVVNSNFVPFTNKQLYELVNTIADEQNLEKSKIEVIENKTGSKISVKLNPDIEYVIGKDEVKSKLYINNSHGGFIPLFLGFGNEVLVCTNGMVVFDKVFQYKIYHNNYKNKYAGNYLEKTSNHMRSIIEYDIPNFKKFSTHLVHINIKNREGIIRDAIKYVTGVDLNITKDQYTERYKHLKNINTLEYKWSESKILERYIHFEMDRKGDNYWGLLNGFTYYTNHENEFQPEFNRNFFITYGYGKIINDRAVRYIKQKIKY